MSMRVKPLISYAHAQHLHDIVIQRHRLDRYDWLATCVRLVPPDKGKGKEQNKKKQRGVSSEGGTGVNSH